MLNSFGNIQKMLSVNLKNKYCIEIEFRVKGNEKFQSCCMGKMPNKANRGKEVYWFGLAEDGSQAFEYDNFENFSSAPVFDEKSLKDIWNEIELISINGCEPEDVISKLLI